MKYKLSLMLILSLYQFSYSQDLDSTEHIQGKQDTTKLSGETVTDIDIDDEDLESAAQKQIIESIAFKTKITNYCRLIAAVICLQYLKAKDYCASKIRNVMKCNE